MVETVKTGLAGKKQRADRPKQPGGVTMVLKHWVAIAGACVALVVAVLVFLVYKETVTGVVNLMNANAEELKEYLLRRPSILYCDRGKGDITPKVLTDLQKNIGDEFDFAALNCDQKLPSGKTLYEKYGLNKKTSPTIFGVAPWAKAAQASYANMKSAATLQQFFQGKLAPKANIITSTSDLRKACGWNKKASDIEGPPCFVVAKGTKFNDDDAEVLKLAMKVHAKAPYVTFSAKSRRLNVEDTGSYKFGAKYYALHNDSHFLAMKKPPKADDVLHFVSHAMSTNAEDFPKHSAPIALVKYAPERPTPQAGEAGSSKKKSKKNKKTTENKKSEVEKDSPSDTPRTEQDEEQERVAAVERQKREAGIRERMSQEERSFLFEDEEEEADNAEDSEYEEDEEEDDNDEDVIEL
jgi:hypothetical protein